MSADDGREVADVAVLVEDAGFFAVRVSESEQFHCLGLPVVSGRARPARRCDGRLSLN